MIELLAFGNTDFKTLISWVETESILVQFAGTYFTFPLTEKQLEHYVEDSNRLIYKVVLSSTQNTIGHAEIYLENRIAILCRIIIGLPELRGRKLGLEIMNALLEISFTRLEAERAELNVFDWNLAAIQCYKKAGLVINTVKTKKREVNGKTWTALNMMIDKTTWENLKQ